MPASETLLSMFISNQVASSVSKSTMKTWIEGICLWHIVNDAPWHGSSMLSHTLKVPTYHILMAAHSEGDTATRPLLTRNPLRQMSWRGYRLASTLMQWLSSVYNNQWLDTWDGTLHDAAVILRDQAEGTYCVRWTILLLSQTSSSGVQIIALGMWIRHWDQPMIT